MKFKKIKIIALIWTTSFPINLFATDLQTFSDIDESPYYNAIKYVHDSKIVNGYKDGTYKPTKQINRAEFTKILIEAKFSRTAIDTCIDYNEEIFSDIPDDLWFSKYVCLAKKREAINGYSDGSFKPEGQINFVEASKILVKVFKVKEGKKGGKWYEEFVSALENNNYIPPTISKLDKKITRAEVAEMIWRIREEKKDQSSRKLLEKSSPSESTKNSTTNNDPAKNSDKSVISSGENEKVAKETEKTSEAKFKKFIKTNYEFQYPSDWFYGTKNGKEYISDEEDYIENLNESGYMDVYSYVSIETINVAANATDKEALAVKNRFDHKEIESKETEINGIPALFRHFRAEEGEEVNGRETQVAENIYQYTFRDGKKVHVLQLFVAYTKEELNLEKFEEIVKSFKLIDKEEKES